MDPYALKKEPKQSRSRVLVDSVVEAAGRLIERRHRPSTNDIADLAGVSVGSLYQYFPNRESIIARWIEKDAAARAQEFKEATQALGPLPLDDKLRFMIDRGVDIFLSNKAIKRHMARFVFSLGRLEHIIAARALTSRILEDLLKPHQDELQIEDLTQATWVMGHAIQGLCDVALLSDTPYDDATLKKEIFRMAWGYIHAPLPPQNASQ